MQSMIPFYLLCVVVLQQIINVTSIGLVERNAESGLRRLPVARRLRVPLMGRSIATVLNDDGDLSHTESIHLDKRRYGLSLLNRRRWMNMKGRGPLFG